MILILPMLAGLVVAVGAVGVFYLVINLRLTRVISGQLNSARQEIESLTAEILSSGGDISRKLSDMRSSRLARAR